jgi:predicted transcriptional regulator
MKDTIMTIRFDSALKEKIVELARIQRRTIASQAAYLMEIGLHEADQESKVVLGDRLVDPVRQEQAGKTA